MKEALKKITDIVNDMCVGALTDNPRYFYRGYLMALEDTGKISREDRFMLIRFYDSLMDDRIFMYKG